MSTEPRELTAAEIQADEKLRAKLARQTLTAHAEFLERMFHFSASELAWALSDVSDEFAARSDDVVVLTEANEKR